MLVSEWDASEEYGGGVLYTVEEQLLRLRNCVCFVNITSGSPLWRIVRVSPTFTPAWDRTGAALARSKRLNHNPGLHLACAVSRLLHRPLFQSLVWQAPLTNMYTHFTTWRWLLLSCPSVHHKSLTQKTLHCCGQRRASFWFSQWPPSSCKYCSDFNHIHSTVFASAALVHTKLVCKIN